MNSSSAFVPQLQRLVSGTVALASLCACTASKDPASAPDGLACASTTSATDAAGLASALSSAAGGSCVLLTAQSYKGSFVVPAGITVAAARGSRAIINGDSSKSPAVSLTGGAGSGLVGVDVVDAPGVGIAVRGGAARIADVNVSGAKNAALAAYCRDAAGGACTGDAQVLELVNVHLTKSLMGLWMSGARVRMTGGESSDHASDGLAGAVGIAAQDGSRLDLSAVSVLRNQGVGVLLDGPSTTGALTDVIVSENSERGLWAQRLAGTLDKPALTIGGASVFEKNKIVGLGGVETHGIIFVGGKVLGTLTSPVPTNLGTNQDIGDGVGLFAGSGDVRFENVTLSANARTAGLIDTAAGGIIFVGGKIEATGSQLKVVVQNTTATLDIPADITSASPVLGVSAPKLPLAKVLQ